MCVCVCVCATRRAAKVRRKQRAKPRPLLHSFPSCAPFAAFGSAQAPHAPCPRWPPEPACASLHTGSGRRARGRAAVPVVCRFGLHCQWDIMQNLHYALFFFPAAPLSLLFFSCPSAPRARCLSPDRRHEQGHAWPDQLHLGHPRLYADALLGWGWGWRRERGCFGAESGRAKSKGGGSAARATAAAECFRRRRGRREASTENERREREREKRKRNGRWKRKE